MGSAITAAPPPKLSHVGQSSFVVGLLSIQNTFPWALPSTDYEVYYRLVSGTSVGLPMTSSKTENGFVATLGISVLAVVGWVAIMNV
jgi:hypothetical protein